MTRGSILHRVAQGSERAFAELYDRFSGETYQTCLRFTPDIHDADQAMFDLWIWIWTDAKTLARPDDVTAAVLTQAALSMIWTDRRALD